jgi:hypothetical protein
MLPSGARFAVCALLVTGTVACGDDGGASGDAETADASSVFDGSPGADAGVEWAVTPPTPPDLPSPETCPDGWRHLTGEAGEAWCERWPEGGHADCGPHEAHFPGEPGCVPIGTPCPSGDFPEGLPTEANVLYVRPGATGGTGTTSAPFGSIAPYSRPVANR